MWLYFILFNNMDLLGIRYFRATVRGVFSSTIKDQWVRQCNIFNKTTSVLPQPASLCNRGTEWRDSRLTRRETVHRSIPEYGDTRLLKCKYSAFKKKKWCTKSSLDCFCCGAKMLLDAGRQQEYQFIMYLTQFCRTTHHLVIILSTLIIWSQSQAVVYTPCSL